MRNFLFLLVLLGGFQSSAQTSADVTFQISTVTTISPPSIQLKWRKVLNITGYNVHRKLRNAANWTTLATNLPESDTFYTDNTVAPGIGYEYRVSDAGMNATGYIYASLNLPAQHHTGKIIVVVDSNYLQPLATEIKTFEMDLIKEGWTVARVNAGRNQSVGSVKQAISNIYASAPGWVKGIAIIGHVPVPYSGSLNPDGHPDHSGAWP
ncbi:MAG: fibronectin type III domain-containing protein, partial [Chitinophagaceae bacterium]|nr:fibronectin type III domain-containing protein [Chitinophagaceae bacterium]